jgi:transcriptional regulator with XRE-family HTH domain
MSQSIGNRIRLGLALRGISQASLAEAIGTSAPAVNAWVRSETPKRPTAENVSAIAKALDVDEAWLQLGVGQAPARNAGEERAEYDERLSWYWQPPPPDEQRVMGNAAGHAFELNVRALVRETGQNILDELLDGEQTVEAEYSVIELEADEARRFLSALKYDAELRPHLEACAAEKARKQAAVIENGLKHLKEDGRLRLIRIADYGANGLTGPEFETGRFMAVCRNTLDSQKGAKAGGSYGLGKATMWDASWMGVVVTNSDLSVPEGDISENRLFVRAELPWHRTGEAKAWNGPGWLGALDKDRECTVSYAGNATLARDLYVERPDDRPGTTFLIVGAYDPSGETEDLESVAESIRRQLEENFWAAMVSRGKKPSRLRASVKTWRGREEISSVTVNPADQLRPMVETLTSYYAGDLVEELADPGDVIAVPVSLEVPARGEPDPHEGFEHEATLLVAHTDEPADSGSVSRLVYLRGNNMTIRDFKLTALPLGAKQFNAVLLAGEAAGEKAENKRAEKFLRAAEPPAHNKWEGTSEVTTRYARGGGAAIRRFENRTKSAIRDAVRDRGGGGADGPESLKELLRLVTPSENPKKPRVKSVEAGLEPSTGTWKVEGTVSLPSGSAWSFRPVLKFGTESGPDIAVDWSELSAGSRCTLVEGRLVSSGKARTATFHAVSDPDKYPVSAGRARIRVDLRDVRSVKEDGS